MASAHTKSNSAIGKSTSTGHTSTKGRLLACACAAANDSTMRMAVFRQRILLQVLQYGVPCMTTFIRTVYVHCTVLYCTTAVVNDEQ
jgi:hypothetical protein